ncbi:iron permease, putative [Babesia ovata]|uniref:Iron permease, putative n=1 Tax=Babesia ovata TaxID=189622 RepID=A0A2H6KJY4_9APIC|nr:iron permease, putative [Babesia ovata]GBE63290.1 iron permease, putative [Babesia ovata]
MPLIPINIPLLQLLDELYQALGESVEHGVRGAGELCGGECLDGRLELREHSGYLVGEVFFVGHVGEEGLQGGVDGENSVRLISRLFTGNIRQEK